MKNIIAVFNSRNKALQFATMLKKMGIRNKSVDSPRELSASCGISIVFDAGALSRAKLILMRLNMFDFVKLYIITGDIFKKYHKIQ